MWKVEASQTNQLHSKCTSEDGWRDQGVEGFEVNKPEDMLAKLTRQRKGEQGGRGVYVRVVG